MQSKLPPGIKDNGAHHVPLAVEDGTFWEQLVSVSEILWDLLVTPRSLLVLICGWVLIFIFTFVLSSEKGPKKFPWWNTKWVYKHVAPIPAIALCMWLVWLPGLRSHIEEVGFRYAQGAVIGLAAFFLYPAMPFLARSAIKHIKRIVGNFVK